MNKPTRLLSFSLCGVNAWGQLMVVRNSDDSLSVLLGLGAMQRKLELRQSAAREIVEDLTGSTCTEFGLDPAQPVWWAELDNGEEGGHVLFA